MSDSHLRWRYVTIKRQNIMKLRQKPVSAGVTKEQTEFGTTRDSGLGQLQGKMGPRPINMEGNVELT